MTAESIDSVLEKLRQMLNRAAAAQAFSNFGLVQALKVFASVPKNPENPDPKVSIGIGDPNNPSATQYANLKQSELVPLLANGGPITIQLGHQWAVFVFTEWDNNFRRQLAAAHQCDATQIQAYVFGDLRRIRHDILHHNGVASKDESGRCDVLHWFQPGQQIVIKGEHIAEFMSKVPWDDLKKDPEVQITA